MGNVRQGLPAFETRVIIKRIPTMTQNLNLYFDLEARNIQGQEEKLQ